MNKSELVRKVKSFVRLYNLTMDQVVVGYGGAMLLLGMREQTQDIDVNVPDAIYDWFIGAGFMEKVAMDGCECIEVTQDIDLHRRNSPSQEVMVTDGVFHHTPQAILNNKLALNRAKDQEDIQVLLAYIARVTTQQGQT